LRGGPHSQSAEGFFNTRWVQLRAKLDKMKHVLRSVNTKIWSDPWFEELNPTEKLLFLYFLTNPENNLIGIYEMSFRRISFETGINEPTIIKALKGFESVGKVYYIDGWIVLTNFVKNQNYNPNMIKAAHKIIDQLPQSIKIQVFTEKDSNPSKAFESIQKGLQMLRKREREREVESEKEIEGEGNKKSRFAPPSKNEVIEFFVEKTQNKSYSSLTGEMFWNHYENNGWKIGRNKMKDWRLAVSQWISRDKQNGKIKNENEYEFDENGNLIL